MTGDVDLFVPLLFLLAISIYFPLSSQVPFRLLIPLSEKVTDCVRRKQLGEGVKPLSDRFGRRNVNHE